MKKHLLGLFLLSSILFVACSDNDDENEIDLISFSNIETIIGDDGDDILLSLSSTSTIYNYRLFVDNKEVEYTNYGTNQIRFDAIYMDDREVSIQLRYKDSDKIVQGPKLLVNRSYSMQFYSGQIANGAGALYMDDKGITYSINCLNSNVTITRRIRNGVTNEGDEYIESSYASMGSNSLFEPTYLDKRDELDRKGFTMYGDNIYTYSMIRHRDDWYNPIHLIMEYNKSKNSFYPYNVIDGDGGMAVADMPNFTTDIRVDSKGTLYTLCADIPGIYKLDKQKGNHIFVGSKTESGDKNGTGSETRFQNIVMFKMDKKDNIYVVEKNRIRMVSSEGTVTTLAGTVEAGDKVGEIKDAQFDNIMGIAIAPDNSIYILEKDKKAIKIINSDRTQVKKFNIKSNSGGLFTEMQYTIAMEVDKDGIIELCSHSYNSGMGKSYRLASIMPNDFVRKNAPSN